LEFQNLNAPFPGNSRVNALPPLEFQGSSTEIIIGIAHFDYTVRDSGTQGHIKKVHSSKIVAKLQIPQNMKTLCHICDNLCVKGCHGKKVFVVAHLCVGLIN
jgi:hypothetical protein